MATRIQGDGGMDENAYIKALAAHIAELIIPDTKSGNTTVVNNRKKALESQLLNFAHEIKRMANEP